ncbi:MAG TPA: LysM peptidoglycan-binding domain-containing protein [Methylophilaceae bacterium]|nr:LysM peptidoglycan-binding domain-containing protein [Methylophilaceae bacterium]
MYRYIITPLLFCCLALPAAADDVQLQAGHPDRYVVVKGDTLWGIAGKFLKDPWLWPKVWQMNRDEIKNPHWIYPGDVVVLDTSNGETRLRLLRETVTLQPGVREEPLEKEPIPTIAPNVIAPFLSQPLVIEEGQLADAPTIIAAQENRVALSPGVRIYVSKIDEGQGALWNIYRPGKALVDPDTGKTLGIEAVYLGDARVRKYGEPASADIVRAKEEIFTKDKLVAAPETLQDNFVPRAPDTDIKGRIISIYGGVAEAGRSAIVTLNRGAVDGLEEGHVLAIYREGKIIPRPGSEKAKNVDHFKDYNYVNRPTTKAPELTGDELPPTPAELDPSLIKLPDERIGLLMVFRTFDQVAYALVMQASEPINVLDLVQTP